MRQIIMNSVILTEQTFKHNVATLLPNFKMTRQGPFAGVRMDGRNLVDPNGVIQACWARVGIELRDVKRTLDETRIQQRARLFIEISEEVRDDVIRKTWHIFKTLLPLCMGSNTFGLVGASKILFAVLPEITLPVDTVQWRRIFQTVDYGDVLSNMADEIIEWERTTGEKLEASDPQFPTTTLPAIYNVMAMHARPNN